MKTRFKADLKRAILKVLKKHGIDAKTSKELKVFKAIDTIRDCADIVTDEMEYVMFKRDD